MRAESSRGAGQQREGAHLKGPDGIDTALWAPQFTKEGPRGAHFGCFSRTGWQDGVWVLTAGPWESPGRRGSQYSQTGRELAPTAGEGTCRPKYRGESEGLGGGGGVQTAEVGNRAGGR